MSTVDLTYQLRAGAEILDTGAIPSVDTWTFTAAGLPWVDQQWGAQVVLVARRAAGWLDRSRAPARDPHRRDLRVPRRDRPASWPGLRGSTALLRPRRVPGRRARDGPAAAAARDGAASRSSSCWSPTAAPTRAVSGSSRRRRSSGRTSTAASSSGRWCWGSPGSRTSTTASHRRIGRCVVAVVSALAACVTPFGPAGLGLRRRACPTNPEVTARITEWQPTSLRSVPGLLFFASALAVVGHHRPPRPGRRRGRRSPGSAVFFVIGVYAQRGVAWWPLAAVAAVAGMLPPATRAPTRARPFANPRRIRRLNVVDRRALVLAGVALLPRLAPDRPGDGRPDRRPDACSVRRDRRAARRGGARRPRLQPADLGVVVRVRAARPPGRDRLAHRAVPARDLGCATRPSAPVSTGGRCSSTTWEVRFVAVGPEQAAFRDRLLGAGWVERYAGADGALLSRPEQARTRTIGAVTPRTGSLDSQP